MEFGISKILKNAGFEQFDAVAGGETAGIPFAAWIAERMMLPMQYVRKSRKGLGATRKSKVLLRKANASCWSRI